MKKVLFIVSIFLQTLCFSQNRDINWFKQYKSYTEYNLECDNCRLYTKFTLSNGCISMVELNSKKRKPFGKKRLRKYKLVYDTLGNITGRIEYPAKSEKITDYNTKYNNDGLVISTDVNCIITKYSDFNEFGKPKLVTREKSKSCTDNLETGPYRTELQYDSIGNIIKESHEYINNGLKEIEELQLKYDNYNHVIEIQRNYNPPRTFPISVWKGHIGGGMYYLYELEKFRYIYNNDGLWTEKYKIVDGQKSLIRKRKFKKH